MPGPHHCHIVIKNLVSPVHPVLCNSLESKCRTQRLIVEIEHQQQRIFCVTSFGSLGLQKRDVYA